MNSGETDEGVSYDRTDLLYGRGNRQAIEGVQVNRLRPDQKRGASRIPGRQTDAGGFYRPGSL
ncbi:hypothetical protein D3C76_1442160 [compost metagenome]